MSVLTFFENVSLSWFLLWRAFNFISNFTELQKQKILLSQRTHWKHCILTSNECRRIQGKISIFFLAKMIRKLLVNAFFFVFERKLFKTGEPDSFWNSALYSYHFAPGNFISSSCRTITKVFKEKHYRLFSMFLLSPMGLNSLVNSIPRHFKFELDFLKVEEMQDFSYLNVSRYLFSIVNCEMFRGYYFHLKTDFLLCAYPLN